MAEMTREQVRDRLGNLEQIRDLLFGQKIEEYDRLVEQNESRLNNLESGLSLFQKEVKNQIEVLRQSLGEEIKSAFDSLEKKLKFLSLNSQQAINQIRHDLDFIEEKAAERNNSLQRLLLEKNTILEGEIIDARNQLQGGIQELKERIFATIEQQFSQIEDSKLSRADLAEVLFELCLKVKGAEVGPELTAARDSSTIAGELLLPEQHPKERTDTN